MNNFLALDTSTEFLSLALHKGDKRFTVDLLAGQSHSQIILPQLQQLLTSAGLQLSDLHGIAFGAGPGSFTGVRIAAGIAQGLAYGAKLPVIGVCTLQALAEASGADNVIACLDARMGEVYHAVYVRKAHISKNSVVENDTWQAVIAPGLYKPESVPSVEGDSWVGVGSGWQTYGEQLSGKYAGQLLETQPSLMPTASAMLNIALPIFAAGNGLPASEAMPIYIRNRVALKTAEREQGLRL